jgi:hypothetical protein
MIQFNLLKEKRIDAKHIDAASEYITEHGGEFVICKRHIEFYVPTEHSAIVALKFPFLQAEQYVWNDKPNTFWPPDNS